jgi:hypothetical protein
MCRAILADILEHCPSFAERARNGQIVATLNHTITVNYQDWTIDLVIGPPPGLPVPPPDSEAITWALPATVQVALEAKAIFTEHGKARRNRLRDLQAFHGYAHLYNPRTIAVGTVALNVSEVFWSPLRPATDITFHENIARLGSETVTLFRGLPLRHTPEEGPGLEAACIVVFKHDNIARNPSPPLGAPATRPASLVTGPPAPQVGDPLHYATMIQRICTAFRARWLD